MFVLECIQKLLAYYHYNKLEDEILQFYIQALSIFDNEALDYAVKTHIARCSFFPKVNELVELAQAYVRYEPPPERIWSGDLERLKERFCCEGHFDPQEWEDLAQEAERAGLCYRPAHVRETLQRYMAMGERGLARTEQDAPDDLG